MRHPWHRAMRRGEERFVCAWLVARLAPISSPGGMHYADAKGLSPDRAVWRSAVCGLGWLRPSMGCLYADRRSRLPEEAALVSSILSASLLTLGGVCICSAGRSA